jgi:hypothetical protein
MYERPTVYELGLTADEAIGSVHEKRTATGGHAPECGRGGGVCDHPGHSRDPRVYLADERDSSPYRARNEGGAWVCYYCEPHRELVEAYQRVMGDGEFRLSAICVRVWKNGRTVVVCTPLNYIGQMLFSLTGEPLKERASR